MVWTVYTLGYLSVCSHLLQYGISGCCCTSVIELRINTLKIKLCLKKVHDWILVIEFKIVSHNIICFFAIN